MDVLVAVVALVGSVALLAVCGKLLVAVVRALGESRELDRSRRTPLGRLLDRAFAGRR